VLRNHSSLRSFEAAVGVPHMAAAVTAAKSGPCDRAASRIAPSVERTPLSASDAVGVGQQATCACIRRSVRLTPHAPFSAALRAKNASGEPPGWATVGVAHSAAATCLGN
jgi:hypothetical protein